MTRRVPDLSKINDFIGWKPTLSLQQILTDVIAQQKGER